MVARPWKGYRFSEGSELRVKESTMANLVEVAV